MKKLFVLALTLLSLVVFADSSFLTTSEDFIASDIWTDVYVPSFDVKDGKIVGWANGSLQVYDIATTTAEEIGTPEDYFAQHSGSVPYISFVKFDGDTSTALVGFTVTGMTDDRIFQVDLTNNTWTELSVFGGNFEAERYDGNIYVSGLNGSSGSAIWLLDTEGGNHVKLIEVGGFSSGFGIDSDGNFYCANSTALYKFTYEQIQNVFAKTALTLDDGEYLSDTGVTPYDVDVDDDDKVIFNGNMTTPGIFAWTGTSGTGSNFDIIAMASGSMGNWLSYMACGGDVFAGGKLYVSDAYYNGLACISSATSITEPVQTAERVELLTNYPNPFNPETTIKFSINESQNVSLTIYNHNGKIVRELYKGYASAGSHEVMWNGKNSDGKSVASGAYIYSLKAGNIVKYGKALMIK